MVLLSRCEWLTEAPQSNAMKEQQRAQNLRADPSKFIVGFLDSFLLYEVDGDRHHKRRRVGSKSNQIGYIAKQTDALLFIWNE